MRDTAAADLDAALALNNANVPALNELDLDELTRLVGMSHSSLTAEVDGAFAGFCITFAPGVDYGSLKVNRREVNQFATLNIFIKLRY